MATYNKGFRVRVVKFLREGRTYQETADIFGVSERSIYTWVKMAKQGKKAEI